MRKVQRGKSVMIDLREMFIRHEGLKLKPYKCPAGYLTIGIGHNIDANGLPDDIRAYLDKNGCITEDMATDLLSDDLKTAYNGCIELYPQYDNFSEGRQAALIDFVFNVGIGTARTFKNTKKAINEGRWEDAAKALENSLWYKQVGNRAKEVVKMVREG